MSENRKKAPMDTTGDIQRVLELDVPRKRGGRAGRRIAVLLAIVAAGVGVFHWYGGSQAAPVKFRSEPLTRGNLTLTVTATGNLYPTNQVDVGSELSGIIASVEVDYNDRVTKGQALARLDTTKLETQVAQTKAALRSAQAKVAQAKATVRETRADLERRKNLRKLSDGRGVSQQDLESAEAALTRALADQASAEASVAQSEATLKANETDLGKAVIRSPIDGVVLVRDVEPGQTVAASLQAPVLFTLAEDLGRMELRVDVDEADVGQVREGQSATFTVDAYPGRVFPATIRQVRFGSETVNGVVTYKTLLAADNPDLSLRPGMTATAEIVTRRVENALLVPNMALRFSPPKSRQRATGGALRMLLPRPPMSPAKKGDENSLPEGKRRIWTLANGQPSPVTVSVGASDGKMTEVTGTDLAPGMAVIVDTVKETT